jgi:hypothetical protein
VYYKGRPGSTPPSQIWSGKSRLSPRLCRDTTCIECEEPLEYGQTFVDEANGSKAWLGGTKMPPVRYESRRGSRDAVSPKLEPR